MTRRLPFYIVDVFASAKYQGNQLAVFRHGKGLSTKTMQAIAKEMHYSETTFILSDRTRKGGYDVRIFTPSKELPFAGHPTLGTAFVIIREIIKAEVRELTLNLKVGPIQVDATYRGGQPELLWMRQKEPTFGAMADPAAAASALGITVDDLDSRYPIESVSTGVPFLIVPLKTRDAIKRSRASPENYAAVLRSTHADGTLLFCPEPYDTRNDLNVRVFVPELGIPEDPATGSGNGCLAAYLVKHRYYGKPVVDLRVEQGFEIGRPSLLRLKSEERKEKIGVRVGGKTILVARGEFV